MMEAEKGALRWYVCVTSLSSKVNRRLALTLYGIAVQPAVQQIVMTDSMWKYYDARSEAILDERTTHWIHQGRQPCTTVASRVAPPALENCCCVRSYVQLTSRLFGAVNMPC